MADQKPQGPKYREENFWFTSGFSAPMAGVGATATVQILLSADAVYKAYRLTLHVEQGAAGAELIVLNWAGTVMITEAQTGHNLMNAPIPADALVGNGQNPYDLAPPRVWAGNTTLIFTFASNVATRTLCNVVLHGCKLIPITQPVGLATAQR